MDTTVRSEVLARLQKAVPAARLVTDPALMEGYRTDRAMFCDSGMPLAVVRARATAEVSAAVAIAHEFGVPVVPQGVRSGLSGAANSLADCLVITLEDMNRVLSIDEANRYVVTQPGVLNAELGRTVAEHGLFYPPDPSSKEFCSIGGNLSTNSGGLCCVKYGVTTDYVLALEVVLADGQVLTTGRTTVKGVAGYDLARLFVGAEGTLGIITEATLRLRAAADKPRTLAATFSSADEAAAAVSSIVTSHVVPSMLEFMDRTSIQVVNDQFQLDFDDDVDAVLLAQSDAGGAAADAEIETIAELLREHRADDVIIAESDQEADALLAARREVLTAFETLGTTMVDDVCVPRNRLAELIDGIDKIAADASLQIGVVGHAGDGNFHPTVVFDPADEDESRRAHQAFDDVMMLGLDLGGTITGEHGVGLLKRGPLKSEVGELGLTIHRAIKSALDPDGMLNPGKIF